MAATETAVVAAGCFWGVQSYFDSLDGVIRTVAGYTGGEVPHPTYEQVCTDKTGHAESLLIEFDPERISYQKILQHFFMLHDPTQYMRQGPDIGAHYRSAIFYQDEKQKAIATSLIQELTDDKVYRAPIMTELNPATEFYEAEDYHQQFFAKRGWTH